MGILGGVPAAQAVAQGRLRRRRFATVALIVLAGVGAAVPMGVWAASRRASNALDAFVAAAGVADTMLHICPAGYVPTKEEGLAPCWTYDAAKERALLASLPVVQHAARFGWMQVRAGVDPQPSSRSTFGLSLLSDPVPAPTFFGEPVVVAGRLPDMDAPDELMINELSAGENGIAVGDKLLLDSGESDFGPPVKSTVTGIIRTPAELLPIATVSSGSPALYARQGWVAEHGARFQTFRAMVLWHPGHSRGAVLKELEEVLGEQLVGTDNVVPKGESDAIEQATDLESRGGTAAAAAAGLAVAFFAGQAVSRQARSESDDVPALIALGMSRSQIRVATALRWLVVSVGAAVLAAAAALAASLLGPIGVARRGPWSPGLHVDWTVLLIGSVMVALLVVAAAQVAARFRPKNDGGPARSAPGLGPVAVRTGLALTQASVRRGAALPLASAVVATGLAIATVIAAAAAATSLHRVLDEPRRFGAPWSALISETPEGVSDRVADLDGVVSAARLVGADATVGHDPDVWIQAHLPIEGIDVTPPSIVAGRQPVRAREIALGSVTMQRSGLAIGRNVKVTGPARQEPVGYTVVGEAMVTDGFEPNVGDGGIVTPEGLARIEQLPPVVEFTQVAVELVDGPARDKALANLLEVFPDAKVPFPVPTTLANAERIAGLPVWLALAGAAAAAATFSHALLVSLRRNRRELAVCRVLGFTRTQVYAAVATQATVLAVSAAALGLLLGTVGARWGWRALADSFGLASGSVVPVAVMAAAVGAAILVGNLAAAIPAELAARRRPSHVLRAE